jgi:STE24 endopeptidase
MPFANFILRKNEFGADSYAAKITSGRTLGKALIKLTQTNYHFPYSHKLYIFFFYSHPPVLERLKELGFSEKELENYH